MAEPKAPAKTGKSEVAPKPSSRAEIDAFLDRVRTLQPEASGRGRLIFAMDATMSRQPSWDLALQLQGDMFRAVKEVGGLDVQLVFFRGFNECQASRWVGDTDALAKLMRQVHCEGGHTQIRKVLTHARQESEKTKVNALVYVGDCMEEDIDELSQLAGELGLIGVPVFVFQEGREPRAERAFKEIARLSRGAYCPFDAGSARQLRELLTAVAVYATGGRKALQNFSDETRSGAAVRLLQQLG
ncbi:MAG: VWA domain-containing protein [Methyloceanibacter sp.]|uniref:VWA domain-containing protein n=1 Tax=Methyloceanibacter sp. TaxID=1965321 RepID=UPI003D6D76D8